MTLRSGRNLVFYSTPEHPCSYLADELARTAFVDPNCPKSTALYSMLLQHGFRRSGGHIYRPYCQTCSACVPVRVQVRAFVPSRRHRRTRRANEDLQVQVTEARYDDEIFALYHRYLKSRHPRGGMDHPTPESFQSFLLCGWGQTEFVEFRVAGSLAAVAVTDIVDDGLSAVYTFFDPKYARRGLGTNALLWQIAEASRRGFPYLYLGYWIERSPKMAYKNKFIPQEHYRDGQWQLVPSATHPRARFG